MIDIRLLRHPYEPSRLALAASALIIGFGLAAILVTRREGVVGLLLIGGSVFSLVGLVWVAIQIGRSRLLGRAARVTPETFPSLDAAISEVRSRLGYHRPVGVFVASKTEPPMISLTSLLGNHIILIEGDFAADLCKPENRAQLDFVLATIFGALKAKNTAWTPALIVINAFSALRVLNVFLAPWQRATVYTGDQVAAAICGDLDQAIIALHRLLVGKELASTVGTGGVFEQAVHVRRQWLPRLLQVFSKLPHLTNRYLNLLGFADQQMSTQAATFRDRLDQTTNVRVEQTLARLPHRRHRPATLRPVAISVTAAVLIVIVLGTLLLPHWNASTPAPSLTEVTGISPTTGAAGGGDTITVAGSGFTGATDVRFGGTSAAAITVDSDTQITATSPADTGTVDVTVVTPGGTSATSPADQFTYTALLTVTGVSPTTGAAGGGDTVTITGSGFTGATDVRFGGTSAAAITVDSDTQITATSPAGTGTVDVTVVTPGGTSATSPADQFTYGPS